MSELAGKTLDPHQADPKPEIRPFPRNPPRTRESLRRLVLRSLRLRVPHVVHCPHHVSPLDYLAASFFDQSDLLIWANRGGGKTYLAAVATLLDAIYHGPLQIRVLGGSFDQSSRLAEYVREFLNLHPGLIDGKITRQRVKLINGSEIRMLPQSERAVRGLHVQKIRCDEVDLFDRHVWQAVQFATRSGAQARGSIEVLSTLHRSGGLMDRLVSDAAAAGEASAGYRLVRWCLWEVIERCGRRRRCDYCPLAEDCLPAGGGARGIAKRSKGYFPIDDAIAIKARSSRSAWEAEMLCRGARREWLVFPEFDRGRHVGGVEYVPDWPVYRAMDFGYRSPMVCLWVQVSPDGRVHVLDEYLRERLPLTAHAREVLRMDPGPVRATYVDPAGRQREATSGAACTELLAAAGIPCTARRSTIAEGLELIRSALAPALGEASLTIHPRCRRLIDAFGSYHYPAPGESGDPDKPVKDGPDHAIDALRYFFINRARPAADTRRRGY